MQARKYTDKVVVELETVHARRSSWLPLSSDTQWRKQSEQTTEEKETPSNYAGNGRGVFPPATDWHLQEEPMQRTADGSEERSTRTNSAPIVQTKQPASGAWERIESVIDDLERIHGARLAWHRQRTMSSSSKEGSPRFEATGECWWHTQPWLTPNWSAHTTISRNLAKTQRRKEKPTPRPRFHKTACGGNSAVHAFNPRPVLAHKWGKSGTVFRAALIHKGGGLYMVELASTQRAL